MDFKKFETTIIKIAQQVNDAQGMTIPALVESVALEFVDDNFQNQGWEGQAWEPSKGTILVKSGYLRRGFDSVVSREQVVIRNETPYAQPHNEGFEGDVLIPTHERSRFVKKGRLSKKTGSHLVQGYKRKMKLPQRQFAPTDASPSPTLNHKVSTTISSEMLRIINQNING